eukprot:CAMPEP_0185901008 /NCGR_PEP_ID=MMETSP0196C-20130402/424_1 /TAXON_ID=2932 /ORGANISM="Alexandrium fundyense, Strain CCMP1719" /LENGTH=43 /DNA_ID= /DNA_START= /DNA_END= /DNA_ORIENTATION=
MAFLISLSSSVDVMALRGPDRQGLGWSKQIKWHCKHQERGQLE